MLRYSVFFIALAGCTITTPIHSMQRLGWLARNFKYVPSALITATQKPFTQIAAPHHAEMAVLQRRKEMLTREVKHIEEKLCALHLKTEIMRINKKMFTPLQSSSYKVQAPLHYAAWFGDKKAVEHLIDKGHRGIDGDEDDDTPLYLARVAGHSDIALMLLATID